MNLQSGAGADDQDWEEDRPAGQSVGDSHSRSLLPGSFSQRSSHSPHSRTSQPPTRKALAPATRRGIHVRQAVHSLSISIGAHGSAVVFAPTPQSKIFVLPGQWTLPSMTSRAVQPSFGWWRPGWVGGGGVGGTTHLLPQPREAGKLRPKRGEGIQQSWVLHSDWPQLAV